MRVLYAVYHANALSEAYFRAEAAWMAARGVEVAFHAMEAMPSETNSGHATPQQCWVGGDIRDTIADYKPDIVHANWVRVAMDVAPLVDRPMTVQGHSFGEGSRMEDVDVLAALDQVKRIWLFPHFVGRFTHPKVAPLPVCFDETRYTPGIPDARRYVCRAAGGKRDKAVEEFVRIAELVPDVDFRLAMTQTPGDLDYPSEVAASAPPNLTVSINLDPEPMADLVRRAYLCLRQHDPSAHPYGMPVSIAEALGAGLPIVARRDPAAVAFIGDAGYYYDRVDEAAELIQRLARLPHADWLALRETSLQRSVRFRTSAVLPTVLSTWESMCYERTSKIVDIAPRP
jgi:hypothetical protein